MKKRYYRTRPEIGQEEFVRHLFSIYAKDLHFEIVNIQKAYPDVTAIDLREDRNKIVHIELEYKAGNFIKHGHEQQMIPGVDVIVVCWDSQGIETIPENVEVIVLSEPEFNFSYEDPTLLHSIENNQRVDPIYKVIPYVSSKAFGKPFDNFVNAKIFRTNIRFKNNFLPKSSVIILSEKGKFIGEFTVLKYVYIDRKPESEYEKQLYSLINFPITEDENIINNLDFGWNRGHIIYTNFKKYDPPVPKSILGENVIHNRSWNLTLVELQKIRGK
ncbi:hypothetical protein ABEX78_23225 [Priestia megaterium]